MPLLIVGGAAAAEAPPTAEDVEFFETRVRPVLVERCFSCHGDDEDPEGELRLTSRTALLRGGATGPAAVPEDPSASLLVAAVNYRDALQMPPDGKLPDEEVAALAEWVARGLPWGNEPSEEPAPRAIEPVEGSPAISDEQRSFWSFQRPARVEAPIVRNGTWARGPLDAFILADLEAAGLSPAASAERRALIRRATFDLTGLPPAPEEVDAFVNDAAPDAFARVVDRLLASPHYGERWGRHWLDLVRYTDSFDSRIADGVSPFDCVAAWRYRDWVVDAINRDLPYDQFVRDQIAGDLPQGEGASHDPRRAIATGMLAIGNWGGGDADKEKLLTDVADDQIDVVTRTFLGLTVACARCHDHKFDPITTADYYGLAGIFMSTHILSDVGPKGGSPSMVRTSLETEATRQRKAQYDAELARLKAAAAALRAEQFRRLAEQLAGNVETYLLAACDYAHWSEARPRPAIEEFAAERSLREFALRGWVEMLEAGHGRLLSTRVDNLLGRAGLFAWRGAADTPSLVANANAEPTSFLSITMPPRSVAIHPSPAAGVAVEWRAPCGGVFSLAGRLQDADGSCGDGVDWAVRVRRDGVESTLASGGFDNGGQQALAATDIAGLAAALDSIALAAGDSLVFAVTPRGNHGCDTTVLDVTVKETGADRVWNLAADVLRASPAGGGNPLGDGYGSQAVWRFLDLAEPASPPLLANAAVRAWHEAAAPPGRDGAERAAAARAAREVQTIVDRHRPTAPAADEAAAQLYTALTSPESPFWGAGRGGEAALAAPVQAELARLDAEAAALGLNPPADPGFAHTCAEGGCPQTPLAGFHDVRVHIRGRYDRLGPVVPRRFPVVLAGAEQPPIGEGSGRRELAAWLGSAANPLTARVMVNRVWQHHFGEGIVRTPSNFGKLGMPPTHPELLDWLALRFIADGWSLKSLHRLIMLSATYQQSSMARREAIEQDGDNLLAGRMNRRRLDAEQLRDSLLAASGQLETTIGGPPVRDIASPRRTLYLMTIRSDRASFRDLFDGADSTAIVDRRNVSTVAPQALFLMNHPLVQSCAALLADSLIAATSDEAARIDEAHRRLFARPATAAEREMAAALLAEWRVASASAGDGADLAAWRQYCLTLLCSNEFVFVD